MGLWEMVLGIVIVVSIAGVFEKYIRVRGSSSADAELEKRVEALERLVRNNFESRLANLETLVTDREYQLRRKFENLDAESPDRPGRNL